MGQKMTREEIEEIKKNCKFTDAELKKLYRRFRKIDVDGSGSLSLEEFMKIPELEHNPLVKRVVETFDSDHSGEVSFTEFITAVSVFATTASDSDAKSKKFQFTFRLYDVDGDGYISNADLFKVLKSMVGSNLNDVQLQQLVDRTILQGDKDKDGKLSQSEFIAMVKDTDFSKLAIQI